MECHYFKKINMIFYVRGHTKNACDRLFDQLKKFNYTETPNEAAVLFNIPQSRSRAPDMPHIYRDIDFIYALSSKISTAQKSTEEASDMSSTTEDRNITTKTSTSSNSDIPSIPRSP